MICLIPLIPPISTESNLLAEHYCLPLSQNISSHLTYSARTKIQYVQVLTSIAFLKTRHRRWRPEFQQHITLPFRGLPTLQCPKCRPAPHSQVRISLIRHYLSTNACNKKVPVPL